MAPRLRHPRPQAALLALAWLMAGCGSATEEKADGGPPRGPCEGILPATVGASVTVRDVSSDWTPFNAGVIGDGGGSLIFFESDEFRKEFWASVYSPSGHKMVDRRAGKFADKFGPRPLLQRSGFQLLEGDAINTATLQTYDSAGQLVRTTPLQRAHSMATALHTHGGSLVLSHDLTSGNMTPYYAWRISAQGFSAHGEPRFPTQVITSDASGATGVDWMGAAVGLSGRSLIVWTLAPPPRQEYAGLVRGAWLDASGAASNSFSIGTSNGAPMDVQPLIDGSVAIAASGAWQWAIRDGENVVAPAPEWLASRKRTRVAITRGRRAHAILRGDPWDPDPSSNCNPTVNVVLVAIDGTECGKLELPAPLEQNARCGGSRSSAALALDGTVVVRTHEAIADENGGIASRVLVHRWWPWLLH